MAVEIGEALRRCLAEDPRTLLFGEDVVDPYGGAFKVTRGLSTEFPGRVRSTPISEAALVGIAAGVALAGYRPIVEIMFGDFVSLCFDQLLNHVTKYGPMYANQATCPVIVRTPSGGGRGYGPTHSQSLEKHFLGIPGLRVVALSPFHRPSALYRELLAGDDPALVIEHKLLYGRALDLPNAGRLAGLLSNAGNGEGTGPVALAAGPRSRCRVTIVVYGYMAVLARQALEQLAVEEEIFAELIVLANLSPLDLTELIASAGATGALLTVEEGTEGWSWGTGVAAAIGSALFGSLRHAVRVLTSPPTVIPTARHQEARMLVSTAQILRAVRELAL